VSPGVVLNQLELCHHGQIVGTELLAAQQSVFVALILATDRDGYSMVQRAKRCIETAGVGDTNEQGE
jgi:hypothetical protein